MLRRLSKQTVSDELPSWHLNILEVSYSTDQKSLLGRGGFGSVYRGEWNGLVFSVFRGEIKTIYLLLTISQVVAVKVMNADLAQNADEVDLKVRELL